MTLRYRLYLEPGDNDTILVMSPDLPIATYSSDQRTGFLNAGDAINVVIESMMNARENVPIPKLEDEVGILYYTVSLQTDLKVRLHQAMISAGLTRADLARRLDWNRESVDRLFRLNHNSRIDQIDQAFRELGKTVAIDVRAAA